MKAEDTITRIRGALGPHLLDFRQKSERRVYLYIAPETVVEAAQLMFEEVGARLQIATGVDNGQGIEVMYHWALDGEDCIATVCTEVEHESAVLDSIADFCPAAEWIEREIWELLGVEFTGHPDLRHLLLSDDWPEGDYPLRRGIPGQARDDGRSGLDDSPDRHPGIRTANIRDPEASEGTPRDGNAGADEGADRGVAP